jgi:FMN reductase
VGRSKLIAGRIPRMKRETCTKGLSSTMPRISIVIGNPKANSRTRRVAELLAAELFSSDHAVEVIDLADYAGELFEWPSDRVAALNASVARSDVVIVASPTYKATYTGLLKAFLDRYSSNGLAGVVAIPVHTGADLSHAMGATYNLAPLLMELGAIVPGKGFFISLSQLDKLPEIVAAAAREYASNMRRVAAANSALVSAPSPGRSADAPS